LSSWPITLENKDAVFYLLATSFYEKGDLEKHVKSSISKNDYVYLLNKISSLLVESELCFVVKDSKGKIVGASINFEEVPKVRINSKLDALTEFMEFLEKCVE
jgi:hypothetical protein